MTCKHYTMRTKSDVTISLDSGLLQKIDGEVEERKLKSRSSLIEEKLWQVYRLKDIDERVSDLIVELMELAAKSPEFVEAFRKTLKNVEGGGK
uniref:Ribbon-helix-helix protein CopG domain-containing protein n=1 Tax=Uncultured archaeon GZfos26G2 TaxID=3386331 RepID=Q648I2_UNCAG|nr:hypothetical protein GZ37D1_42 [uncultured archaeon GZfos37D1]